MSELVDTVTTFIDEHSMLTEGQRVLVGASGGADSMTALDLLRRLGYDVGAVHVNYGLRNGADADEVLVRRYCSKHDISLHVARLDAEARADRTGESLQAAARGLRYEALAEVAVEREIDAVVTGHHRDDQAETVLLNLLRGAGPEGVAGMPPSRFLRDGSDVRLLRPLLPVSRTAIEAYTESHDVSWHADPTNEDSAYDRAFLRTEILPRLSERFDGAPDNLARAAGLMREYVDATLAPALEDRLDRCFRETDNGGWVDKAPLFDEPPVWRQRVLLAALQRTLPDAPQSHAVADELTDLLGAQVGAYTEFGSGVVWRERGGLRFVPDTMADAPVPPTPVPWGEDIPVAPGTLRLDPLDDIPEALDTGTPTVAYADADRLPEPLTLRSWEAGDRLRPLGMEGKTKLVSDLLTDAKVPPHHRKSVCVLATEDHLAWVIGHRLDNRVRVRPDTERVVRLRWEPASDRENGPDNCNLA